MRRAGTSSERDQGLFGLYRKLSRCALVTDIMIWMECFCLMAAVLARKHPNTLQRPLTCCVYVTSCLCIPYIQWPGLGNLRPDIQAAGRSQLQSQQKTRPSITKLSLGVPKLLPGASTVSEMPIHLNSALT